MILIVLVVFIAILVASLNFIDNSNLEKIENYFKEKKCENIIYAKGSYKGFCGDSIMEIPNSFSIDLNKEHKILKLKDINKISQKGLTLIINDNYKIEFNSKNNIDSFYKKIKREVNK